MTGDRYCTSVAHLSNMSLHIVRSSMGDTQYGRLRKGEESPVLIVCVAVFALPSGAGKESSISLYLLKRPCKRLDYEGDVSIQLEQELQKANREAANKFQQ